jgi:ornithine cyclodeaminase/alanine dehydrogenase-like protein (mu-crystallin family)
VARRRSPGPAHLVSGRRYAAAAALANELEAEAVPIGELLDRADVVVTATAATAPLFEAGHVRRGTHLTALGADMPGKQELPPSLFGRAAFVATDDVAQSLDHGDLGHAVRGGHVDAAVAVALGTIVHRPPARDPDDITIADLTGVGVVDAVSAIALQDH